MMSLRHFSAVRTLNGKSCCFDRKWRFSVTNMSAPVHSVYAAIKASAGFRPFASYWKTISKGTTISSSMAVMALIKLLNSRNASGDKFRFTSSNIVRGMRALWPDISLTILSRRCSALLSFDGPKANIYSFESMMMSNFFLPELFSCFSQSFYNIFFAHLKYWRRVLSDKFTEFFQMFFGFFNIFSFHNLSPHFNAIIQYRYCQEAQTIWLGWLNPVRYRILSNGVNRILAIFGGAGFSLRKIAELRFKITDPV